MTPRQLLCLYSTTLLALAASACRTAQPVGAEQAAVSAPQLVAVQQPPVAASPPVRSLRDLVGPGDPRMPGTYDLFVCYKVACAPRDTTAAHYAATVVLLDSADAMRLGHLVPGDAYTFLNGCFRAYHNRRRPDSLLGLDTAGLIFWHPDRELRASTRFGLLESPDAGYVVRVMPTIGGFVGHGFSAYAFGGPPTDRDTVVAVQVGDANVSICRNIPPAVASVTSISPMTPTAPHSR